MPMQRTGSLQRSWRLADMKFKGDKMCGQEVQSGHDDGRTRSAVMKMGGQEVQSGHEDGRTGSSKRS